MTPRERLRDAAVSFQTARGNDSTFRYADKFVDALDSYLDSKRGQTLRERLLTAFGVCFAECRTRPAATLKDRQREEHLEAILNDAWLLDRLAGILERT